MIRNRVMGNGASLHVWHLLREESPVAHALVDPVWVVDGRAFGERDAPPPLHPVRVRTALDLCDDICGPHERVRQQLGGEFGPPHLQLLQKLLANLAEAEAEGCCTAALASSSAESLPDCFCLQTSGARRPTCSWLLD